MDAEEKPPVILNEAASEWLRWAEADVTFHGSWECSRYWECQRILDYSFQSWGREMDKITFGEVKEMVFFFFCNWMCFQTEARKLMNREKLKLQATYIIIYNNNSSRSSRGGWKIRSKNKYGSAPPTLRTHGLGGVWAGQRRNQGLCIFISYRKNFSV